MTCGVGSSGAGGQGGGPFNPVEQALLAEKCTPENRNRIFATNACVGSIMGSLGALASGLPQFLQEDRGWSSVASYKPLFLLTIAFSIALLRNATAVLERSAAGVPVEAVCGYDPFTGVDHPGTRGDFNQVLTARERAVAGVKRTDLAVAKGTCLAALTHLRTVGARRYAP